MFKTIAVWFGWFDTSDPVSSVDVPTKTIDEVYDMIKNYTSFKAIVNRDVYKQLQSHTAPSVRNLMSSHYTRCVYYDGRRRCLFTTDFPDSIIHDEIKII